MRKVMLLAAMLAMVLAAAAPAFAQDTNINVGDDVEYNAVCQNILGALNISQNQNGNANATAIENDVVEAADLDAASSAQATATADATADATAEDRKSVV